jgi:integrase
MAPRIRSYSLENRTNRLKLRVRRKAYSIQVAVRPAVRLAYYRRKLGAGTWSKMVGNSSQAFATADDFEEANGDTILTYHQAVDRARQLARGGEGDGGRLATVAEALDGYAADLKARGGHSGNATRVRVNLPDALARKSVVLLSAKELRQWRDGLLAHMRPSSVNRTANALKAALNLAAKLDTRIAGGKAWETGLASFPDSHESRNVILADDVVRAVVAAAYTDTAEFGLFVETCAITGARVSQLARLRIADLQADRLMMPPSRKGGRKKRSERRPVPIPQSLAMKLRTAAEDRGADALLLLRPSGPMPWDRAAHTRPFQRAAIAAGLDPAVVTIAALRHSSIVRMLLAGVPIRVVASNHDTSVAMIERTYSKYITDHTDALTRRALLDIESLAPGPQCGEVIHCEIMTGM